MNLSVRARALVVVAASASLLALPLAVPASAVSQPGACKKLTEKTVGGKITATVSQCTPLKATGGSGHGPVTTKKGQTAGTVNVTFTWATHHGTTKATAKFAPNPTPGKCPAGSARIKITGKITGGTGTVVKTIKAGQPVTGSVCANAKTGAVQIEPGTTLKF
jgi:hypothetical protein